MTDKKEAQTAQTLSSYLVLLCLDMEEETKWVYFLYFKQCFDRDFLPGFSWGPYEQCFTSAPPQAMTSIQERTKWMAQPTISKTVSFQVISFNWKATDTESCTFS